MENSKIQNEEKGKMCKLRKLFSRKMFCRNAKMPSFGRLLMKEKENNLLTFSKVMSVLKKQGWILPAERTISRVAKISLE